MQSLPLPPTGGKLAYLASRHPVVSHTFVDNEILALEALGWPLVVASLNPPKDEFIHPRLDNLQAKRIYPPAPAILDFLEQQARQQNIWPKELIAEHNSRFGKHTNPAQRARNALWLANEFRRLEISHVHLHFANAATHTALFLQHFTDIGFSFTPQAKDFLVETSQELLEELCSQARFVIAPCKFAAQQLELRAPASKGKTHLIYNGIDPQLYPPPQAQEHDEFQILSVGRFVPIKGFADLISAFAQARKTSPTALRLRLIGDGPLRAELEAQVTQLNLSSCVDFLGQTSLEKMRQEMAKADLFALAATADSQGGSDMFPTVITEAMFCSLPVLASKLAGIPEQVLPEQTGILCAPQDQEDFAQGILRFARNRNWAKQLGTQGKQYALEQFNQNHTLPKLAHALHPYLTKPACVEQPNKANPQNSNSQPVASHTPAKKRHLAFYNISLPSRIEWLLAEAPFWFEQNATIVLSGTPSPRQLAQLSPILSQIEWLPDGMVLENNWQRNQATRNQVAQTRQDLSSSICGETLFQAARQACWLAKSYPEPVFFAPATEEALVLTLAKQIRQLSPSPCLLMSCLIKTTISNEKLHNWIAAHSDHLDQEQHKASNTSSTKNTNALLHQTPAPEYWRFGPFTSRKKPTPLLPSQRKAALAEWTSTFPLFYEYKNEI